MQPSDRPTPSLSTDQRADTSAGLTGSDWAASRGEKWRAHLPRLEAMLQPVDDPLIRALRLDRPYRIAEVGSGGGGTTLEISRQAPAGSVVHGFDITPGLVELARERAQGFVPESLSRLRIWRLPGPSSLTSGWCRGSG